jgi:2-dehydro-3-deoxyphosphogluconate aldolase / (4S)-4-hydroxy-2-oxoglutarate aldolase
MTPERTRQLIETSRLIAIVRIDDSDAAIAAGRALVAGGVSVLEFSLAVTSAWTALSGLLDAPSAETLVGAGTVMNVDDAERAVAAGARFLVSPNLAHDVAECARRRGVLHVPGVMTPTELAVALDDGAELVKLFPAARLGPEYVRDLLAPFPAARLVPTGGIDADNARPFLEAGAAAVAVGGALTKAYRDNAELTRAARRFVELTDRAERSC